MDATDSSVGGKETSSSPMETRDPWGQSWVPFTPCLELSKGPAHPKCPGMGWIHQGSAWASLVAQSVKNLPAV